MKIKIDLKIFIFLLIFVFTRQVKIYLVLMIFALLHECGHLTAGLMLKLKPDTIKIMPYGFSIEFKADSKDYNTKIKRTNKLAIKRLFIALAGPITNLIIIICTYLNILFSKNNINILTQNAELIIYANLLIIIFNLLPIYPMDGGRILKEIIHIYGGLQKSYIYTNLVANATLIILTIASSIYILFYRNIAILIILIYLWIININRNKYFENKEKILETIYCKNFE